MLLNWVERDGLARSVLMLLAITTIGSFSYSWGYYEGYYNAKILTQLEHDAVAHPGATQTPDAHERKVAAHPMPTQTVTEPVFSQQWSQGQFRTFREKLAMAKAKRAARRAGQTHRDVVDPVSEGVHVRHESEPEPERPVNRKKTPRTSSSKRSSGKAKAPKKQTGSSSEGDRR